MILVAPIFRFGDPERPVSCLLPVHPCLLVWGALGDAEENLLRPVERPLLEPRGEEKGAGVQVMDAQSLWAAASVRSRMEGTQEQRGAGPAGKNSKRATFGWNAEQKDGLTSHGR